MVVLEAMGTNTAPANAAGAGASAAVSNLRRRNILTAQTTYKGLSLEAKDFFNHALRAVSALFFPLHRLRVPLIAVLC